MSGKLIIATCLISLAIIAGVVTFCLTKLYHMRFDRVFDKAMSEGQSIQEARNSAYEAMKNSLVYRFGYGLDESVLQIKVLVVLLIGLLFVLSADFDIQNKYDFLEAKKESMAQEAALTNSISKDDIKQFNEEVDDFYSSVPSLDKKLFLDLDKETADLLKIKEV